MIDYFSQSTIVKKEIKYGYHFLSGGKGIWVDGEEKNHIISNMNKKHLKNCITMCQNCIRSLSGENSEAIEIVKKMIEEKEAELQEQL